MRCSRCRCMLSLAIYLLLSAIYSPAPLMAEEGEAAGILFMRLHISEDGVSLVESSVVPGSLKKPRAEFGPEVSGIYYDVRSETDSLITSGRFDNPLIRKLEYEDPDNPGALKQKIISLTETDFMLRIAFSDQIRRVTFYELDSSQEPRGGPRRIPLGTISINAAAGGAE